MNPNEWKSRWTLITGASAGIGKTFAEALAAGGSNLILTARRADRLSDLAATLRQAHGISVETFAADLGHPDTPAQLHAFTESKGIPVDFLINNAGFGLYGEFAALDGPRQRAMVDLNCTAVVALTHLYLPAMIARKRGDILILASTASFQAIPYMAVYAATKAFDLLFAEALAVEVQPHGVRVCALCPGATESEFQQVSSVPASFTEKGMETSGKVVRVALEALQAGKHSVVSGTANNVGVVLQRLLPRRTVTGIVAKLFRPKT